jgi:transcriptional regulator with XRE-family HTH domain
LSSNKIKIFLFSIAFYVIFVYNGITTLIGGEEMPFIRERLKQRRVDMGLTLQEIADTIGVEKPTVQRYESGKISKIDTLTVEKLANAVRCNPAYLLGWDDSPNLDTSNDAFTIREKDLIYKYRSNPSMQAAVDRLLGIEPAVEAEEKVTIFRAAQSEDNAEPKVLEVPKSRMDKIKNGSDVDEI